MAEIVHNFKNIGEVRNSPIFIGLIQSINYGSGTANVTVACPKNYGEVAVDGVAYFLYHCPNTDHDPSYAFSVGDLVIVKMKVDGSSIKPDAILNSYDFMKPCCGAYIRGKYTWSTNENEIDKICWGVGTTKRTGGPVGNPIKGGACSFYNSKRITYQTQTQHDPYRHKVNSIWEYSNDCSGKTVSPYYSTISKSGGTCKITVKNPSVYSWADYDYDYSVPANTGAPRYFVANVEGKIIVISQDGIDEKVVPLIYNGNDWEYKDIAGVIVGYESDVTQTTGERSVTYNYSTRTYVQSLYINKDLRCSGSTTYTYPETGGVIITSSGCRVSEGFASISITKKYDNTDIINMYFSYIRSTAGSSRDVVYYCTYSSLCGSTDFIDTNGSFGYTYDSYAMQ